MRAFYAPANKNYELKPDNFSKEEQQHKWVEANLQLLFPSLELVESKPRIASKIPDTVAYDHDANTFVAIEYKNRRSDTVREQAEDYLIKMRDNHGGLASRYNDRPNVTHRTSDSFDWERMYVVIIAPEFTDRQVSVADHRDTECLYELKRFESGFVTLRFAGGKHPPIDAPKPPSGPPRPNRPLISKIMRPNTHFMRLCATGYCSLSPKLRSFLPQRTLVLSAPVSDCCAPSRRFRKRLTSVTDGKVTL